LGTSESDGSRAPLWAHMDLSEKVESLAEDINIYQRSENADLAAMKVILHRMQERIDALAALVAAQEPRQRENHE